MKEKDIAPIKHRMVVGPEMLCKVLGVQESDLHSHDLSVPLNEFMKIKEAEGVELEVDAYKKVGNHYLVHLKGDEEHDHFTFADVLVSDLAKAMNTKQSQIKSNMNEEVFGKVEDEPSTEMPNK